YPQWAVGPDRIGAWIRRTCGRSAGGTRPGSCRAGRHQPPAPVPYGLVSCPFQPGWIAPDRTAADGWEGVIARSGSRPPGIRFAAATAGLPDLLHRPTTAPIFCFAWCSSIIFDLLINGPLEYFHN